MLLFVLIQWVEVLLCLPLRELHVLLESLWQLSETETTCLISVFHKGRALIFSNTVTGLKNGIKQNTFPKHMKISISSISFPIKLEAKLYS